MPDKSFHSWPFFEARHRALAEQLEAWAVANLEHVAHDDVDATCRTLVAALGRDGWLKHTAPDPGNAIRQARCPHARADPRNAGAPLRPRRLCLRHAGAGRRADLAVRQRGAA